MDHSKERHFELESIRENVQFMTSIARGEAKDNIENQKTLSFE
jgi:hypothetical protein